MRMKNRGLVAVGTRREAVLRALVLGTLTLATLTSSECSKYYDSTGKVLPDDDSPTVRVTAPPPSVKVLNDNRLRALFVDPPGANGATPSGVDPTGILATYGDGVPLPLTSAGGGAYDVNLNAVPDGSQIFKFVGKDLAGNIGGLTYSIDIIRSFGAPAAGGTIAFTNTPAAVSTTAAFLDLGIGTRVTNKYLGSVQATAWSAGLDGQCGTADDVPLPTGSTPGALSENSRDLTLAVKDTNKYSWVIRWVNAVLAGQSPKVSALCFGVTARDNAKGLDGLDKPNSSTIMSQVNVSWAAPAPVPGGIVGNVTRAGLPLAAVTVTATQSGVGAFSATTATNGSYAIPNLVTGNWQVGTTCPGGTALTQTATVVSAQNATVNFDCPAAPAYVVNLVATCKVNPTFNQVFLNGSTNPVQAGATYVATLAGQFVTGQTQFTGTLTAQGTLNIGGNTSAFGPVMWTVTVTSAAGVVTSTVTKDVQPAGSACT